jgi:transposase InsO family protein
MDEKVLFLADYLRGIGTFSLLCERYGVSRKTGYKWVGRYRESGFEGLAERSHRPRTHGMEIPVAIRQAVLDLRASRRDAPGPKKIQALLAQRFGVELVPSKTSIYNILKAAGQIETRRRRRRVAPSRSPLRSASRPNELWSADYKGQFRTRDSRWCYPLTVMDHASRYLLACEGRSGTGLQEAKQSFAHLFREYGLPERLRTDNGVPFATTAVAGLSRLSIWWIRLGIVPERIEAGQPQQNGRHERMHRTLKRCLGQTPGRDLDEQQIQLDVFRQDYNEQRPHESLGQKCPAACYQSSPRAYPEHLPELEYPRYFHPNRVCQTGLIYWRGLRIYIGYLLAGEWIGLEEVGNGEWDAYFGVVRIGGFNERDTKGSKNDYLTLNVSPM